jgi:hypothetical protein
MTINRKIIIGLIVVVVAVVVGGGVRRSGMFPGHGALPPAVLQCLQSPQQMTLYSLQPDLALKPRGPGVFRGYTILGETTISSPDAQHRIVETLQKAMAAWTDNSVSGCFNPRHGIRVSNDSGTYELVICFECQHVDAYSTWRQVGSTGLVGSPAPLDDILRAAKIPLPTN